MEFFSGNSLQRKMEKGERNEDSEGRFFCGLFLTIFYGFCVLG